MTVSDLISALGDTVVPFEYQGDESQQFRGLAVQNTPGDTRRRFWVMRGPEWKRKRSNQYGPDGSTPEDGIANALRDEAAGLICNTTYKGHPSLENQNVFFTPNTFELCYRIVEAQRRLTDGRRMIAVTGSAGKSTTCSMLAGALRGAEESHTVQQNDRNRNLIHHILAQQSRFHRFSSTVLEVAGSVFVRDRLDFTVSADVSIVTSISEAHLNYLDDLAGVARYKSDIFKRPPTGGLAVVNLDAPYSEVLTDRAIREGARLVTYGESAKADIRLTGYDLATGRVHVNVCGLDVDYTLRAKGKHLALNSLAVLATLRDLGMDWAAGMASLEGFVPPEGRGQEARISLDKGRQFTLIDGSYNANPASVRASLKHLAETDVKGRRVAVLGDILELGAHAKDIHLSLAEDIRAAHIDSLHIVGERFLELHDEEPVLAGEVHRWEDINELIARVPGMLQDRDVVLIKGSGGTGLKKLAALFINQDVED